MPGGRKQTQKMAMDDLCQRCFLRLAQFPDHICVREQGLKTCQYCRAVRHACIPLPEEFVQEAEDAIKGPANKLSPRVRAVRRKIVKRTRNIRKDKRNQQFLDHILAEALSPPEDFHHEECEVCDDASFSAAAEQQLLTSLAEAATASEGETVGDIKVQADEEEETSSFYDCELGAVDMGSKIEEVQDMD